MLLSNNSTKTAAQTASRTAPSKLDRTSFVDTVSHRPGSVILYPGKSDMLYRVSSGLVRIHTMDDDGNGLTLRYVKPGDYFGEEALAGLDRQYFAEAVTDSSVDVMNPALMTAEDNLIVTTHLVRTLERAYESIYRLVGKRLRARHRRRAAGAEGHRAGKRSAQRRNHDLRHPRRAGRSSRQRARDRDQGGRRTQPRGRHQRRIRQDHAEQRSGSGAHRRRVSFKSFRTGVLRGVCFFGWKWGAGSGNRPFGCQAERCFRLCFPVNVLNVDTPSPFPLPERSHLKRLSSSYGLRVQRPPVVLERPRAALFPDRSSAALRRHQGRVEPADLWLGHDSGAGADR